MNTNESWNNNSSTDNISNNEGLSEWFTESELQQSESSISSEDESNGDFLEDTIDKSEVSSDNSSEWALTGYGGQLENDHKANF